MITQVNIIEICNIIINNLQLTNKFTKFNTSQNHMVKSNEGLAEFISMNMRGITGIIRQQISRSFCQITLLACLFSAALVVTELRL